MKKSKLRRAGSKIDKRYLSYFKWIERNLFEKYEMTMNNDITNLKDEIEGTGRLLTGWQLPYDEFVFKESSYYVDEKY